MNYIKGNNESLEGRNPNELTFTLLKHVTIETYIFQIINHFEA